MAALAIAPFAIRSGAAEYADAVRESGRWIPILLVALAVVLAAYWLLYVHNDLVGLRERVDRARSLVTVQAARRHDLLPQLADATTGAAQHERGLLTAVAAERSGADLIDVVAVAERNPALSATEGVLNVQAAIVDTENRLALARRFCNDSVTLYNARRATLPASLVARLFGFPVAARYETDRNARSTEGAS